MEQSKTKYDELLQEVSDAAEKVKRFVDNKENDDDERSILQHKCCLLPG